MGTKSRPYVCRKCGRTYSLKEYFKSRFCRSCGTYLFPKKEKRVTRTPRLRISSKIKKPFQIKLRSHPKTNRAPIDADAAYFLGLLLARGRVNGKTLTIRIPCRYENAADHRDFLLGYVIDRMEKATGEKIKIRDDRWKNFSFDITIESDFFINLIRILGMPEGEVCRLSGVPYEIFNSNNDVQRDFVKGIGDCCGEVDKYFGGRPRVCLRFLNENIGIIEDVVEVLIRSSVEIFDVNLSPPSPNYPLRAKKLGKLETDITSRYDVNVTGRTERIGRDNMIRMWAEEYYNKVNFCNQLRQQKLVSYLREYK